MNRTSHRLFVVLLLLASALFGGCAHNNARDPLEPLNRGIYAFNDAVDSVVLKPVATGYREIFPQIIRTGVTNFFSNLDDIVVILNGVLQFKLPQALSDTARFLVNSTVGLLGVIDVATHLGLEKHNEDFGQTLGYWGISDGPYLVLPFLGPSSVRDGIGRLVDVRGDTVRWQDHVRTRNQFMGLRIVNTRAGLLGTEKVLETAAIDEYAFVRDAYLQRRRSLVYDGNPPPEKEDEDLPGPRSGAETFMPVTRVEDQWGGLVASSTALTGGHTVELLRSTSTAPRRPAPAAAPAPAAQPAATAPAALSPQSAAPASTDQPGRVVRVWVSSGAH